MSTTGLVSTYDLPEGTMLDMEDSISLLDPTETPVQNGYIGPTGASVPAAMRDTTNQTKVEWLDEQLRLPRSVLNAAFATGADTTLDLGTTEIFKVGVGDVLLVEEEYLRVTAVNYGAGTATVTRGYGASSGVAHASGTVVTGVGKALPEGSDPEAAVALSRNERFNITQIFGPEAVKTSGTKNAIRQYGVKGTEHDKQVANRLMEQAIQVEQALFYGQLFDDTANEIRTLGGMTAFIQTHVDSSTTTLTDTALATLVGDAWDDGGNPNLVEVGFAQKRVISGFDSTLVRYVAGSPADGARGQIVDRVDIDGVGSVFVALNRWVRSSDLFLRRHEQLTIVTLRPWMYEQLAKTGDSRHGQVLAEKTLKFKNERHAGRMSALT